MRKEAQKRKVRLILSDGTVEDYREEKP